MKQDNLFNILQNSAVGTIALHSFVLGYFNVAKHKEEKETFPRLEYLFYVLPIVFNENSMETFRSSNQLYTALKENNTIILGLQERSNKMSVQTFDALNIAFSKKILTYNKENKTIELLRGYQTKKLPLLLSMNSTENSVKKLQDSANKLGAIFAKRHYINIQTELNIRF